MDREDKNICLAFYDKANDLIVFALESGYLEGFPSQEGSVSLITVFNEELTPYWCFSYEHLIKGLTNQGARQLLSLVNEYSTFDNLGDYKFKLIANSGVPIDELTYLVYSFNGKVNIKKPVMRIA